MAEGRRNDDGIKRVARLLIVVRLRVNVAVTQTQTDRLSADICLRHESQTMIIANRHDFPLLYCKSAFYVFSLYFR